MDGWPLRAWSWHGWVTVTCVVMTWMGDRYVRGHHMAGWPLRAWSSHGRVTVTCVVMTWLGDRYVRGHDMDGWPLRAWSWHGWVTVTCVVMTWMGDRYVRSHDMAGWPLRARLCARPENSPESNLFYRLHKSSSSETINRSPYGLCGGKATLNLNYSLALCYAVRQVSGRRWNSRYVTAGNEIESEVGVCRNDASVLRFCLHRRHNIRS